MFCLSIHVASSPSRENVFEYDVQATFAGAKPPHHLSAVTNRTQRILNFQEAIVLYKVHAMLRIIVLFILQLDAKLTLQRHLSPHPIQPLVQL